MIEKGTITGFAGSWGSGLGHLLINGLPVMCENGATVRALEGCFGNVIGNAHNVETEGGHVGQEVYYSTDGMGILEGFTPVDEASEELIEAYEAQEEVS